MVNNPNSSQKRCMLRAVLIAIGASVLYGCGETPYVGSCHPSLPCQWTHKTGEVACLYTEAVGNHKPGDRCP
jgi:hypothetical protein